MLNNNNSNNIRPMPQVTDTRLCHQLTFTSSRLRKDNFFGEKLSI